ncbi:MAG TPA: molybdenum cofactor biosynthesis protein MoaE [Propionicimonas sp.]|nr:molybdenum cofactor biosynthesis protein MoaE [Propionicimonas sp.]
MDARIRLAEVTADPCEETALLRLVERPDAGAAILFVGRVRDHDPQATGEVVGLDYTAHPSAAGKLVEIVTGALVEADPDGGTVVAVAHRIGHLDVGEVAFVVAVSAAHRRLAFEVCELIVERVKHDLPVWKQQFEADGSYRWSGL